MINDSSWITPNGNFVGAAIPIVGTPRAFILDFEHPAFTEALKNDFAEVDSNGEKKAFALSVAEVNHLSGPGKAFPTMASRGILWLLRTRFDLNHPWAIIHGGGIIGSFSVVSPAHNAAVANFTPSALILRDQEGAWTSSF